MVLFIKRNKREKHPHSPKGGLPMPKKEEVAGQEERAAKEKAKKQVLLRLSPKLWNELADWAEDDFRSINGQIEYLLTECVKKRKNLKEK